MYKNQDLSGAFTYRLLKFLAITPLRLANKSHPQLYTTLSLPRS